MKNKFDIHGHHRMLEIAIFSLVLALGTVFSGFVYLQDVVSTDIVSKNLQVDALIREVGELKEENVQLYQEILEDRNAIMVLGGDVDNLKGSDLDVDALVEDIDSLRTVVDSVVTESTVSSDDTFDVLILGTHGALTDTIMVASFNSDLETVSLISIPRDLSVNGRKINEHYNLYGGGHVKQITYDILGILPEKYVVVDMQAFVDIVDTLGGLDVYVEKEIYDTSYPNVYGGYSTFYVSAGQQYMDGSTALKYARSRKSTSDFDRAKRQQQIVQAVSDQVAQVDLVSDASKAVSMFQSILDNMDTDLGLFEGIGYYSDFKDYEIETGHVLSTSNYLYSTHNVYGQYILLPSAGNYGEVWEYVAGVVSS